MLIMLLHASAVATVQGMTGKKLTKTHCPRVRTLGRVLGDLIWQVRKKMYVTQSRPRLTHDEPTITNTIRGSIMIVARSGNCATSYNSLDSPDT